MKLIIFYLLYLQVTFLIYNVDGAKIIPLFDEESSRRVKRSYMFDYLENLHMPTWHKHYPMIVNGSSMPGSMESPDYRLQEKPFLAYPSASSDYMYFEFQRPLRISPHRKQTQRWKARKHRWFHSYNHEYPENLGCYCTTVYKKLILLAGCAVITNRHVLTTATSTDVVLRQLLPKKPRTLQDELGFWYDSDKDVWNSSIYMSVARIHYHPRYMRPHLVNISHPIPCLFDLAVWTTLIQIFAGSPICPRGASHWWEYQSTTPWWGDIAHIVGFQFMKAYKKVPMPWYKYAVRTKKLTIPCPKTEWGWYHCIPGNWAKFGLEPGAAWSRALMKSRWVYDGLIGLAAFSMQLRSEEITHYFTVLNTHTVLDFLYSAYKGLMPPVFLDARYYDSRWGTPALKPGPHVPPIPGNMQGVEYDTKVLPYY